MSFLPYGSSSVGGWITASGGAFLLHGAAIAVGIGGLQNVLALAAPEPPDRPEYTITIAPLDSDTIAGLLEQDGEAGANDGEGIDPAAPDTLEEAEPEQLAALAPEESVTAEPVTPEALEPEPEPEELAALEPETPEAIEPEAATPEAVEPEAIAPEAIEPEALEPETVEPVIAAPEPTALEPITPLAPAVQEPLDTGPLIPETVTALPSPQALSPLAPVGTAGLIATPVPQEPQTVPSAPQSAQTIRPTQTAGTVVGPVVRAPAAPVRTPQAPTPQAAAPAPSAQDIAVGDLLRRIRTAAPETCLLALPRRDGENGVGLALIASSDSAMARFSDAVLTQESDADIRQTRVLVDERQCSALNYVRDNTDYPATQLGIRLDSVEVASGDRVTGVLRGTAGRYVTLLLVDNNGVVQDLQRFMSFSGNFTRFDVPVTLAGGQRDTKQMLLAIATRRPAPVIKDRTGQLARDVFAALEGEVATQAALAVTTFDVR